MGVVLGAWSIRASFPFSVAKVLTKKSPACVEHAPVRSSSASTWIFTLQPTFSASSSTVGAGPASTLAAAAGSGSDS